MRARECNTCQVEQSIIIKYNYMSYFMGDEGGDAPAEGGDEAAA